MRFVSKNRQQAYRIGHWAEMFAALFYMFKGYRVLRRRYKTKSGEVDLILRRGQTLVFAEVKYRKDLVSAREAVRPQGRRRIEKAAGHYILENPELSDMEMRFDVVAVVFHAGLPPVRIDHLDNAWLLGS